MLSYENLRFFRCPSVVCAPARASALPVPLLALALGALTMLPAFAHAATAQRRPHAAETVVTATRTPTRVDELMSDTVVIERAQIEQQADRTLPELLARIAGIQMTANGGAGKPAACSSAAPKRATPSC